MKGRTEASLSFPTAMRASPRVAVARESITRVVESITESSRPLSRQ
jgi:hypothetical protein